MHFSEHDPVNGVGQVSASALRRVAAQAALAATLNLGDGYTVQTPAGQVLAQPPAAAAGGTWVKVTSASTQTVTLVGGATVSYYPALLQADNQTAGGWVDGAACWFVGSNGETPASGSRYLVGLKGADAAGKGIYSTEVAAAGAATFSGAKLSLVTSYAIAGAAGGAALTWDTVLFDTDSYANLGTHPTTLVAPAAGRYLVGASAQVLSTGGAANLLDTATLVLRFTDAGGDHRDAATAGNLWGDVAAGTNGALLCAQTTTDTMSAGAPFKAELFYKLGGGGGTGVQVYAGGAVFSGPGDSAARMWMYRLPG